MSNWPLTVICARDKRVPESRVSRLHPKSTFSRVTARFVRVWFPKFSPPCYPYYRSRRNRFANSNRAPLYLLHYLSCRPQNIYQSIRAYFMRSVKFFFLLMFSMFPEPKTLKFWDFRMEPPLINSTPVGNARNFGSDGKHIQSASGNFFSLLYATGGTD